MSFVRKNAAPASAESLRAAAGAARQRIPELSAERDEIIAALPELVADPTARREAEDRLAVVEAELSRERRTVALIEEAIPEAEKREARAQFDADLADLERRTAKSARTLKARYEAAGSALAALLDEMAESDRAWDRMRQRATGLGVTGGQMSGVEFRLRRDFTCSMRGFGSLHSRALVEAWDGRTPLFRGANHQYQ